MMNLCNQLVTYGPQLGILLAIVFTMLACSKLGKKHREETAYLAVVGISLMSLVFVFCGGILRNVMSMIDTSQNVLLHALWIAVVSTAIITALIILVGKQLKVKPMEPKKLALCFFIGIALSNLVGVAITQQCSAPAKVVNNR